MSRFKVDDGNFPKIDDEQVSDSDDSMVLTKYPFTIRRSDFDNRDAYRYNSVDQYANHDDDDSDRFDEDDSDKDDEDVDRVGGGESVEVESDSNRLQVQELDSRKRASGLVGHIRLDHIDDLEGDVEVEEITTDNDPEPVVSEDKKEASDSDEEPVMECKIKGDIMSPEDNKTKDADAVDD